MSQQYIAWEFPCTNVSQESRGHGTLKQDSTCRLSIASLGILEVGAEVRRGVFGFRSWPKGCSGTAGGLHQVQGIVDCVAGAQCVATIKSHGASRCASQPRRGVVGGHRLERPTPWPPRNPSDRLVYRNRRPTHDANPGPSPEKGRAGWGLLGV